MLKHFRDLTGVTGREDVEVSKAKSVLYPFNFTMFIGDVEIALEL